MEDRGLAPHEPEGCSLCGGELMMLGKLGKIFWLRCRHCGMEFPKEVH